MTFKIKLFVAFIVYGLSLVLFTQIVGFKLNEQHIKSASLKKASEVFRTKDKMFQRYIQNSNLKLLAIKNSKIFKNYQLKKNKAIDIESFFLNIAATSDNIMQLRYIDKSGMERVRIDRKSYASTAYIVSKEKLQDKSKRYYFTEAIHLDEGEFWYSKLDLNIEHSEIEKPIKPVIRVATVVTLKGEKIGVLIINIFMKNFLKELSEDSFNNIYLFDRDGRIMVDSRHKQCWSRYLKNREILSNHFLSEEFNKIIEEDTYRGSSIYASKIFLKNGEEIRMIVEPKIEHIEAELSLIISNIALILLGVVLISFPLSYFFSQIPAKLKEKVDKQKREQDVLLSLFDLGDAVLFKYKSDEKWSVSSVSKSVEKLLGYQMSEFKNSTITYAECIYHDDLKRVIDERTNAIQNKVYFFEHEPYRVVTKDRKLKWILDSTVIVRDKKGEIINFIGYLTDITELKNQELDLEKISRTDQLTQICNRMYIDELLHVQYYRFKRSHEECSIILIDIDYFKLVNDKYGHIVGDKVLIQFANLMKDSIRIGDFVGRWGGEEFLVILPHTNLANAMLLAEKLRELVHNCVFDTVKHKTASFGVATFKDGMSIENLIDVADKALYNAKDSGRNRISTTQEEF